MQIKRMSYTDLSIRKKQLEKALKVCPSKVFKSELITIKTEMKTRFNPAARSYYVSTNNERW